MTRSEAIVLLRRRLNEVTADNWSDSTLFSYLNVAYAVILTKVRKANPEALVFWEYRDLTANQSWYEKPSNAVQVVDVAVLQDGTYVRLERRNHTLAEKLEVGADTVYCHRGKYIGLFPAPTATVSSGLRMRTVPTDSLSTDDDEILLEASACFAVVLMASILAKGESPEDDGKDQRDLAALTADIPTNYSDLDLNPLPLSPDVADARAFTGGTSLIGRNDVDPGR